MPNFSESTPAALLYHGTRASQKTFVGTISTISELQKTHTITPPSILVVGKVAKLAHTLNWREMLPLFGHRIILLRSLHQGENDIQKMTDLGAEVIHIPMIHIVPNKDVQNAFPLTQISEAKNLIFTSANGVTEFMSWLMRHKKDARFLYQKTLIAIGEKTSNALQNYGLIADHIPQESHSEGILNLIKNQNMTTQKSVLLTATGARQTLSGKHITRFELYKSEPTKIRPIDILDNDWVFFTSASTVTHFFQSKLYTNQKIRPVAIGPITQNALESHLKLPIITAQKPTIESMLESVLEKNNVD
jgi:uroporphyrinogen III methyltransferase/synthase